MYNERSNEKNNFAEGNTPHRPSTAHPSSSNSKEDTKLRPLNNNTAPLKRSLSAKNDSSPIDQQFDDINRPDLLDKTDWSKVPLPPNWEMKFYKQSNRV